MNNDPFLTLRQPYKPAGAPEEKFSKIEFKNPFLKTTALQQKKMISKPEKSFDPRTGSFIGPKNALLPPLLNPDPEKPERSGPPPVTTKDQSKSRINPNSNEPIQTQLFQGGKKRTKKGKEAKKNKSKKAKKSASRRSTKKHAKKYAK